MIEAANSLSRIFKEVEKFLIHISMVHISFYSHLIHMEGVAAVVQSSTSLIWMCQAETQRMRLQPSLVLFLYITVFSSQSAQPVSVKSRRLYYIASQSSLSSLRVFTGLIFPNNRPSSLHSILSEISSDVPSTLNDEKGQIGI